MTTHTILPDSFLPHGEVSLRADGGELRMTTNTTINTRYQYSDSPIKHYAYIARKFRLPFAVQMTAKIDSPELHFIVGRGHVDFASASNRAVTDILGGDCKPNTHVYDSYIPLNEYVDITVTYGTKAFWISINGKLRCMSVKDPYIKALKANTIPEEFAEGFGFAIACDKRTTITVKSLTVTEYDSDEPTVPAEAYESISYPLPQNRTGRAALEECSAIYSPELRDEILTTDDYIMNAVKNPLKFKRTVETKFHPYNLVSYVSPVGVACHIKLSGAYVSADIGWIAYNTVRERTKFGGLKKADYSSEVLNKLAETSSGFADEMAFRMKECVKCNGGYCMHTGDYEYNGKVKASCGGTIQFKMLPGDFADLRRVVGAIKDVIEAVEAAK